MNSALRTHAAPSRGAISRSVASLTRALYSPYCRQCSSLRPAKPERRSQISVLLSSSALQSALPCSSSSRRSPASSSRAGAIVARARAELKALIFDCDGVILESEGLHRVAYNATFAHFDLRYPGKESQGPVEWSEEFYDDLQNKVGGGKPKMHHVFGNNDSGYPSFSLPGENERRSSPGTREERDLLVDTLQAWKSRKYEAMISGGEVAPRPGVLRLMDSAKESGLKVGVCSAATKSSVVAVLDALLGPARVEGLDVFLAGDDVKSKKPDPEIYETAARRLGVAPESCCVVEDSSIGVAAAVGAGMRCVVTYTPSTASQAFGDAERVVSDATALDVGELREGGIVQDDRVEFRV